MVSCLGCTALGVPMFGRGQLRTMLITNTCVTSKCKELILVGPSLTSGSRNQWITASSFLPLTDSSEMPFIDPSEAPAGWSRVARSRGSCILCWLSLLPCLTPPGPYEPLSKSLLAEELRPCPVRHHLRGRPRRTYLWGSKLGLWPVSLKL